MEIMKKTEEPKIELSLEAVKEVYKEQEENIKSIVDYALPDVLEDIAYPLTFGEKKKLKKHNIKQVDTLDDDKLDDLLLELLELRKVDSETIDAMAYSDLQIWVRKIAILTFNTKAIATKK